MRPYDFIDAQQLREAAEAYFKKCEDDKAQDKGMRKYKALFILKEPHPYTIAGLCQFIGVSNWAQFVRVNSKREGFADTIEYIERTIRSSLIAGAIAGVYSKKLVRRITRPKDEIKIYHKTPPDFDADEWQVPDAGDWDADAGDWPTDIGDWQIPDADEWQIPDE